MNLTSTKTPKMNVRFATPEDTSGIIELLKDSLGESTIPKSESLWDWKHNKSPFGPSYVMIAEEEGKIIGVRAFMQWKWIRDGIVYNAIRAVDTATHPSHQGKGIFKKLTLGLASECQKNGIHYIFNTPNEQSRLGYLKMGWQQVGKMPLNFFVNDPVKLICNIISKKKKSNNVGLPKTNWTNDVYQLLENLPKNILQLSTVFSPEYLSWRYGQNPLFDYHYMTDGSSYLLIYRIKAHNYFDEFRVTDFYILDEKASVKKIRQDLRRKIEEVKKQTCFSVLSISTQQLANKRKYLPIMGVIPSLNVGPIVTVKDLNMHELFPNLLKIKNWGFSLGDMELF